MFHLWDLAFAWRRPVLPRIPAGVGDEVRDYYLIAGGLALVLSRCPPQLAPRRFEAATRLYLALSHLGRGIPPTVDSELISEVSHEVAEFTDRATRDALLRRMRAPCTNADAQNARAWPRKCEP